MSNIRSRALELALQSGFGHAPTTKELMDRANEILGFLRSEDDYQDFVSRLYALSDRVKSALDGDLHKTIAASDKEQKTAQFQRDRAEKLHKSLWNFWSELSDLLYQKHVSEKED